MIKTALKHFIYEQCIDVMFAEVYNNFVRPRLSHSMAEIILNDLNGMVNSGILRDMSVRTELDGTIVVDVTLSPMMTLDRINIDAFIERLRKERSND